jgi:hypothetical protein
MKLILIIVTFLFLTNYCFGQESTAKRWHRDSLLTWNDFKGTPDSTSKMAAMTFSWFDYDLDMAVQEGKNVLVCTAASYFIRKRSWSVKGKEGIVLLAHEQVHFDLTAYFARLFETSINNKKYPEMNGQDIRGIANTFSKRLHAAQLNYDDWTNHGIDIKKQRIWCNFIADALENNLSEEEFIAKLPK